MRAKCFTGGTYLKREKLIYARRRRHWVDYKGTRGATIIVHYYYYFSAEKTRAFDGKPDFRCVHCVVYTYVYGVRLSFVACPQNAR